MGAINALIDSVPRLFSDNGPIPGLQPERDRGDGARPRSDPPGDFGTGIPGGRPTLTGLTLVEDDLYLT